MCIPSLELQQLQQLQRAVFSVTVHAFSTGLNSRACVFRSMSLPLSEREPAAFGARGRRFLTCCLRRNANGADFVFLGRDSAMPESKLSLLPSLLPRFGIVQIQFDSALA